MSGKSKRRKCLCDYRFDDIDMILQTRVQDSSNVHTVSNLRQILHGMNDDIKCKKNIIKSLERFGLVQAIMIRDILQTCEDDHVKMRALNKIERDWAQIKDVGDQLMEALRESL